MRPLTSDQRRPGDRDPRHGAAEGRQRYVYSPTIFSIPLSGPWHIPEIIYLRDRSIFFRRLAKDYDDAGQHPVCAKLREVAADFEAPATELERKRANGVDLTAS
jgi:hypothetical protein